MMTPSPAQTRDDLPHSFDTVYRTHAARLRALLTLTFRDTDLAEDVCAEAFVRALARWHVVGRQAEPAAWVYRVAVNVARRRHRRRQVEARLWSSQWVAPVPAVAEGHPEVWAAVGRLTVRQREAIGLRYIADLDESGVAAAMGVKVGTASATLAQARQRLREALGPDHSNVLVEGPLS